MQLHHAVLGLGDLEAERLEGEVGGEPDVAAAVRLDGRPEHLRVRLPRRAVHTVRRDDQVVRLAEPGGVRGLRAETEFDAECAAAVVQDLQEAAAAQCGEAVAAGGVAGVPVDDVDVVPAGEVCLQGLVDQWVGMFYAAQRLVGEDHSEAEGVVGGVAFPDGYLAGGIEAFEEDGGVQAAGAAADDGDAVGVAGLRERLRVCRGRSRPAAEPHIGAAPRPWVGCHRGRDGR